MSGENLPPHDGDMDAFLLRSRQAVIDSYRALLAKAINAGVVTASNPYSVTICPRLWKRYDDALRRMVLFSLFETSDADCLSVLDGDTGKVIGRATGFRYREGEAITTPKQATDNSWESAEERGNALGMLATLISRKIVTAISRESVKVNVALWESRRELEKREIAKMLCAALTTNSIAILADDDCRVIATAAIPQYHEGESHG